MAEGFMFQFGDGDEMPEPLRALLQGLARSSLDTGLAHDPAEDELMPSDEQLAVGPGDHVVLAHLNEKLGEFEIGQVVDPEEHAEEFPDWEDRLLKSFVLLNWYSKHNLYGRLGWRPRAKMILINEDHWQILKGWLEDPPEGGVPRPAWLIVRYHNALYQLALKNPDRFPIPIRCCECKDPGVLVRLIKHSTEYYAMGTNAEDAEKDWGADVPFKVLSTYDQDFSVYAELQCENCGHSCRLPDEIEMFG